MTVFRLGAENKLSDDGQQTLWGSKVMLDWQKKGRNLTNEEIRRRKSEKKGGEVRVGEHEAMSHEGHVGWLDKR